MGRTKSKTCTISGKKFAANTTNFYSNKNSEDGLHPYHKSFDNFRRTMNASVDQVRNGFNVWNNLINN